MSRKKQLKVNGGCITEFNVEIREIRNELEGKIIKIIYLEINVEKDAYKYDIRKDDNAPDLNIEMDRIKTSLQKARDEMLNVEIPEDTERFYLYFKVQDMRQVKYTGRRL